MVAGDAAELAAATVALLRDPARARAMASCGARPGRTPLPLGRIGGGRRGGLGGESGGPACLALRAVEASDISPPCTGGIGGGGFDGPCWRPATSWRPAWPISWPSRCASWCRFRSRRATSLRSASPRSTITGPRCCSRSWRRSTSSGSTRRGRCCRPGPTSAAVAAAAGLQALVLIAVYFFRQDLLFPRSIFVVFAVLNAALLMIWRLGCSALLGGYPRRRVLVVGTNATAAEVIDDRPRPGLARARHRRRRRQQLERHTHPGARVGAGGRHAREPAGAVRAVRHRRGDHRLRPVLAGSPPRRVQPRARRAVAHLGGAVAVRDPDRPAARRCACTTSR